jgi:hypothetical protein
VEKGSQAGELANFMRLDEQLVAVFLDDRLEAFELLRAPPSPLRSCASAMRPSMTGRSSRRGGRCAGASGQRARILVTCDLSGWTLVSSARQRSQTMRHRRPCSFWVLEGDVTFEVGEALRGRTATGTVYGRRGNGDAFEAHQDRAGRRGT